MRRRRKYVLVASLAAIAACSEAAPRNVPTSSVASAANADPGATSLVYQSPKGLNLELRTVTPASQPDPIYLRISGVDGETSSSSDGVYRGDIVGPSADDVAASLITVAAAVMGIIPPDSLNGGGKVGGLTFQPVEFRPIASAPSKEDERAILEQVVGYIRAKAGVRAATTAGITLARLGFSGEPCGAGQAFLDAACDLLVFATVGSNDLCYNGEFTHVLTLRVSHGASAPPIVGARVRACLCPSEWYDDGTCPLGIGCKHRCIDDNRWVVEGTTDADGSVVPEPSVGVEYYGTGIHILGSNEVIGASVTMDVPVGATTVLTTCEQGDPCYNGKLNAPPITACAY